ncbi:MerR family transcriptional regulator [Terracidiphilus sp.]|jgi:DNA-binding transcriptional MerR regulator|uniref:MerR family transcriptional regulator n=1 Tax=Terracidiphilus sp. TaxID=1964191 RepID=UPI003C1A61D2
MRNIGYTIRTMAERCGMTTHTLRYYERVGLIQPVGRARNGHRRYSETDAVWLEFLHCMRDTNIPIRELQRYAALREQGEVTSLERRKILEDHQSVVATQIEALEKAHAILTHKIANYRKIEEKLGLTRSSESAETEREEQQLMAIA